MKYCFEEFIVAVSCLSAFVGNLEFLQPLLSVPELVKNYFLLQRADLPLSSLIKMIALGQIISPKLENIAQLLYILSFS